MLKRFFDGPPTVFHMITIFVAMYLALITLGGLGWLALKYHLTLLGVQ